LEDERLHHHRELFEKLAGLNYVERDELFKRQAFLNVRRYPLKYCFNWVANLGRMWYAYPFSYKYQRPHTLFYMVPNSFLLVSILFCCYPLWKRRRDLPGELVVLIGLAIIFLAGSSLIYASQRFLMPLVPVFVIVIFFTAGNLLEIRFHRGTKEKLNE
jgi:type IV secretory pathway VirB2 component (pilin)